MEFPDTPWTSFYRAGKGGREEDERRRKEGAEIRWGAAIGYEENEARGTGFVGGRRKGGVSNIPTQALDKLPGRRLIVSSFLFPASAAQLEMYENSEKNSSKIR